MSTYNRCFVVINANTGDIVRRFGTGEYGGNCEQLARQDACNRNLRSIDMKLAARYGVAPELEYSISTGKRGN